MIFDYAEDANAFATLPRASHLFRARYQPKGKTFASAGTLGPPPIEHAVQTNRMSPPGVVMMYAADDENTALAETAAKSGTYVVGDFVIQRDILVLDLTRLPPVPSIFAELLDSLEYDPRPRLGFLHRINMEISRPIARDDRVHVEYVPTQVVTEYARTAVTIEGQKVDGIRYQSSRHGTGTALVLFADQDNLILEKDEQPEFYFLHRDLWIRLSNVMIKSVTARDIKSWHLA